MLSLYFCRAVRVDCPASLYKEKTDYEGKNYPGTNVEYKRVRIQYHGEKIEGVFPQFEGKDREVLPRKLYEASDDQQFSYCTRALAKKN